MAAMVEIATLWAAHNKANAKVKRFKRIEASLTEDIASAKKSLLASSGTSVPSRPCLKRMRKARFPSSTLNMAHITPAEMGDSRTNRRNNSTK